MAKYSNADKITKMTLLLRGMQHPQIQELLAARGLDQEEYDEGWRLFDAAMGRSLVNIPSALKKNRLVEVIAKIDQWENCQFEIADAGLRHKFPQIHAEMFQNLTKMSGAQVLVSVGTFVTRYEALAARTDDTSKAAVALLAKRGVTAGSVAEVKALLDQARNMPALEVNPDEQAQLAAMDEAVHKMWAWYQEWAQTARATLTNKRLRIHLGISSPSASKPEEPETPSAE